MYNRLFHRKQRSNFLYNVQTESSRCEKRTVKGNPLARCFAYFYFAKIQAVILLFTFFFGMGIFPGQAQLQPELTEVFPQGGQQGSVVEVTLIGTNLRGVTALWFSGNGITAELKEETGAADVLFNGTGISGHIPKDERLVASLTVAPDVPLGPQQVRVVTADGVSNARNFVVGALSEILEDETGAALDSYNWLELPVTVNGDIASIDDEDGFSFSLEKGARLICDVTAQRIGSLLDSYLVLRNADGTQVADSGLGNGLDSLLDYTAPASGKYTLQIRDIRYKGGKGYGYRLSIGELPYLENIFPLGGRRGSENIISVSGANLQTVNSIQISIEAKAEIGSQSLRVKTPSGFTSNPHSFAIGDLPEMTEAESTSASDKANFVDVPITFNGKIEPAGDVDMFSFEVEAGQRLVFVVDALSLGSQLDALLTLYDAENTTEGSEKGMEPLKEKKDAFLMVNDDASGADARIEWMFEKAGKYSVSIRDLNNQGGEDYGYRFSIRPLAPDYELTVVARDNRNRITPFDNPRVHRGSSVAMQVEVTRLDGFTGPIRLTCPALPKTFDVSHALVAPGQNQALLTVRAPWDAPLGLMPVSIVGVCAVGNKQIKRTAIPDAILLTVMDTAEFSLTLAEISLSAVHNKAVNVHVTASRRSNFAGAISLSVLGLPARVSAAPLTIAEGETEAMLSIKAGSFERREQFSVLPIPGTSYISVSGTATVNGETVKQTTPAIPLTIVEAPFIVIVEPLRFSIVFRSTAAPEEKTAPIANTIPVASKTLEKEDVPTTKEAILTLSVVRQGGFTDEVTLTPLDLPEGITTSETTLPANETEIQVPLQAVSSLKSDTYQFKFQGAAMINGVRFQQDSPVLSVKIIQ